MTDCYVAFQSRLGSFWMHLTVKLQRTELNGMHCVDQKALSQWKMIAQTESEGLVRETRGQHHVDRLLQSAENERHYERGKQEDEDRSRQGQVDDATGYPAAVVALIDLTSSS